MSSLRKSFCLVLAGVFVLPLLLTGAAIAETFPSKPITIIVPSKPGGSFDSQARAITTVAKKYFGVPVVVENVPGAAFTIGAEKMAKSKPDGYTLHSSTESPFTSSPLTLTVDYDPRKDIEYICSTAVNYQAIVINGKHAIQNADEMFAYAKQNPGALTVSYSSVFYEFLLYQFMDLGYVFTPVVFSSASEASVACGGGHTDMYMGSLSSAKGLIESGDVRALIYSSCTPDRPTLKGGTWDCDLKDADARDCFDSSRLGIQAPKGIPADRLQFLEEKLHAIFMDPDFQAMMTKMGFGLEWQGREENTKHYFKVMDRLTKLIEKHKK